MTKYDYGFSFGNFQPYHKGHRHFHRKILKKSKKILVSPIVCNNNLFSYHETQEMILNGIGSKYQDRVVVRPLDKSDGVLNGVRDLLRILNENSAIFVGSFEEMEMVESFKELPRILINQEVINNRYKLPNSVKLRQMLLSSECEWKQYIPKNNWNTVRRIVCPMKTNP